MDTQKYIWYLPKEYKSEDLIVKKSRGKLIFKEDRLIFKGRKNNVVITNIQFIEYGKQGADFINNWVKIVYKDEKENLKTAFFADGKLLGWGGIFGGTKNLFNKIKLKYFDKTPLLPKKSIRNLTLKSIAITFLIFFGGVIVIATVPGFFGLVKMDSGFSPYTIMSGVGGAVIWLLIWWWIFLLPVLLFQLITSLITLRKNHNIYIIKIFLIIEFILIALVCLYFGIVHNIELWYYYIGFLGISEFLRYKYINKRY